MTKSQSTTNVGSIRGFTIVELLIVIVVIAILAAISVVAYRGIQDRAADSAVQSDIRIFASKVMEYHVLNGVYPDGRGVGAPGGLKMSLAHNSYASEIHNFIYCTNASGGGDAYILVAASKSGKKFAYSSNKGAHEYMQSWGGVANVCTNEGYPSAFFSYGHLGNGRWYDWTM